MCSLINASYLKCKVSVEEEETGHMTRIQLIGRCLIISLPAEVPIKTFSVYINDKMHFTRVRLPSKPASEPSSGPKLPMVASCMLLF